MKTVQDILKESGLTDEQITAIDAKVMSGLTTVHTTAAQEREAAENAKRLQQAQYDGEIAPALDNWANEQAKKDAEIAFYKTQLEGAKAGGFVPAALPGQPVVTPPPGTRGADGKFVAGQNPVPGSPAYMTREEGFSAVTNANWFVSEHMRLNGGAPPPDDMESVWKEAAAQRMPFRQYVEKKYEFQGKRDAIKANDQKKHDDAIRAEVSAAKDKEFAEKFGNNPNIRQAQPSSFSQLDKAVKQGERKDPLKMTERERSENTHANINKEIAERSQTVQ